MSFPPTLGITSSFIIDSNCSLVFQEFSSLLPQLEQIYSPFSKQRMNGYSRIKKPTSARSKSVDFADLSLTPHTPRSTANLCSSSRFKSQETKPSLCNEVKITTVHNSIPEQEHEEGKGEVFGIILGRKCSVSSGTSDQKVVAMQESSSLQLGVAKRSFSIRRSASVSEGYSRIHHQSDLTAEDDDEFSSLNTHSKKKGKFFRAFKRLFGL